MTKSKRRWLIWITLLVIPLPLVIGLEALLLWVFVDETNSPPRIIDGEPDNAPRHAALALGFIVAALYLGYAALVAIVAFAVTRTSGTATSPDRP